MDTQYASLGKRLRPWLMTTHHVQEKSPQRGARPDQIRQQPDSGAGTQELLRPLMSTYRHHPPGANMKVVALLNRDLRPLATASGGLLTECIQ
ncbi:hypothetical protein PG985_011976 [Apiospora marii]|uniref:Uncharacterized protein n=1 Tax=Apiospora marii TaxID=335849 RepID=A0ABR1RFR0_9PEZI